MVKRRYRAVMTPGNQKFVLCCISAAYSALVGPPVKLPTSISTVGLAAVAYWSLNRVTAMEPYPLLPRACVTTPFTSASAPRSICIHCPTGVPCGIQPGPVSPSRPQQRRALEWVRTWGLLSVWLPCASPLVLNVMPVGAFQAMPTHVSGWEDEQASTTSRSVLLGNSHAGWFMWSTPAADPCAR